MDTNINESDFTCDILSESIALTEYRKNIIELFDDFNDEYVPIEMDWGQPVGKEI